VSSPDPLLYRESVPYAPAEVDVVQVPVNDRPPPLAPAGALSRTISPDDVSSLLIVTAALPGLPMAYAALELSVTQTVSSLSTRRSLMV